MTIYIEDLKFQAIIGILDFERERLQDIIVNLEIDYMYENDFINYAEVANNIKTDMIKNQYLLLEDALQNISTTLKKDFSQINRLYLKITKPSILHDCKVSVAEIYHFNS